MSYYNTAVATAELSDNVTRIIIIAAVGAIIVAYSITILTTTNPTPAVLTAKNVTLAAPSANLTESSGHVSGILKGPVVVNITDTP